MSEARTLEYQPALDGLRAVAVALVLGFHGGYDVLSGGYLGVSVFFTLSGYLITTLLLVEHMRSGTLAIGRFYSRRMKRLLPASLVCLLGVVIAAGLGAFDYVTTLRRDVVAALFHVANWAKLTGDASYAELTNATLGRVGPLEHYWSLAIEEQFYWLWPLVMLMVLRLAPSVTAVTIAIVGLACAGVVAAPVIAAVWGPDVAYWSTPARIGEILIGAALAAVLHRRRTHIDASIRVDVGAVAAKAGAIVGMAERWMAVAGLVGAAVIVWAATSWPASSGPAYEGWLPAFALASAAVIVGLQVRSPLSRVLSLRPIVWIGSISYGLYLYHWPLFALLTEDRVDVDGSLLFAIRISATFAVSALSAYLVELPVRRWSPSWPRPLTFGAIATVLLAVAAVVVIQSPKARPAIADGDKADAAIQPVDSSLAPVVTLAPSESPVVPSVASTVVLSDRAAPTAVAMPVVSRPVRILVLGDSTATYTAAGLVSWAADHPDLAQVTDASVAGCGFVRGGVVPTDGSIDWTGPCNDMLDERLPVLLADLQPDVVMLMVTMRDVEDRQWSEAEGALSPFDRRFRQRLFEDYAAMADGLISAGVDEIGWVLAPYPIAPFQGEQRKMLDPERYHVQFDVIAEIAGVRPDAVHVIDLRSWLADQGGAADGALRPDGLHWTEEASRWVSDRYLAPTLVTIAVS
jgi:peptidoglycan/LPS O-acetylase OafA/YrhL